MIAYYKTLQGSLKSFQQLSLVVIAKHEQTNTLEARLRHRDISENT
jgi:hypothetical protein